MFRNSRGTLENVLAVDGLCLQATAMLGLQDTKSVSGACAAKNGTLKRALVAMAVRLAMRKMPHIY